MAKTQLLLEDLPTLLGQSSRAMDAKGDGGMSAANSTILVSDELPRLLGRTFKRNSQANLGIPPCPDVNAEMSLPQSFVGGASDATCYSQLAAPSDSRQDEARACAQSALDYFRARQKVASSRFKGFP
mmetsp:Transcript_28634/g.46078  ORF Transcript_28634/g.46078 Transcript_28634/m.46078 type:complete len:128 (-) Transcript_28634:308-691(-)